MPKGGFLDDSFEKLAESGQSDTGQNTRRDISIERLEKGRAKKQNHTPLDTKKLQDKYQDQDKIKAEALRNRLFQLVKSGEEKAIRERKRKEVERQRQLLATQEQKKKKEEEKKKKEAAPIPKGKVRRSIFAPIKKTARAQQTEVRPSTGKQ